MSEKRILSKKVDQANNHVNVNRFS